MSIKQLITIVIPIFKLHEDRDRLNNFETLIRQLVPFNLPIIVSEQIGKEPSPIHPALSRLGLPTLTHLETSIDNDSFHKSMVINRAVEHSSTEYVWEIDSDCILPIHSILTRMKDASADVIKPFRVVVRLNEDDSRIFRKTRTYDGTNRGVSFIRNFGPLSFIIRKDVFMNEGMMDERFVGYGWEDLEFAERVKSNHEIVEFDEVGIHLHHAEPTPGTDEQENRRRFIEVINRLASRNPVVDDILVINTGEPQVDVELPPPCNIVHIIAPALREGTELFRRETLAIRTILDEANGRSDVRLIMATSKEIPGQFAGFIKVVPPRTAIDMVGDSRDLPLLSDVLDLALSHCNENSIIAYSNSDCCIRSGTYDRMLAGIDKAIEYHRRDVFGGINSASDVFTNGRRVMDNGLDMIALHSKFYADSIKPLGKLDFFLGEPHWDTCLGGFLRKLGFSSINTRDLFHPWHADHRDAWKGKLPPAAEHNTELYREYLEYGLMKSKSLSVDPVDTSIVIVHFGNDEKRIRAAKENFKELDKQLLETEILFIEAVDGETHFPEMKMHPLVRHVKVPTADANRGLCQKEALMNIGGKMANGKYVLFIDSDVHSKDVGWLGKVRRMLVGNPDAMVQCFHICTDSEDADRVFVGQAAMVGGYESDMLHNPGLAWGFSKDVLEHNGWFNPYIFYGSGDSLLFAEYSGIDDPWLFSFPKIAAIARKLPVKCRLMHLDGTIVHVNHGFVSTEFYKTRHKLLDTFEGGLDEYLFVDDRGLLSKRL